MAGKRKQAAGGPRPSLVDSFPGTPRPWQVPVFQETERTWEEVDVLGLNLPVAWGKKYFAMCLMRWLSKLGQRSCTLNPNNLLNDQYTDSFPRLHTLRAMGSYECKEYDTQTQKLSCEARRACDDDGKFCPGCKYLSAVRGAHAVPYGVYNTYTYMAHRLFRDVVIFDEAHSVLDMMRDNAAKVLWHRQYRFPRSIRTYSDLLAWTSRHPERDAAGSKVALLHRELSSGRARYLAQKTTALYRGHEEECIKLLPIDVSDQPPLLWPAPKVRKLVLLSATISRVDIEQMGLAKRRVRIIQAGSPIPVERRPIRVEPIANMSFANWEQSVPAFCDYLRQKLAAHPGEAGMVHLSYSLASAVRDVMGGTDSRLLFHDNENKGDVYRRFREEGPAKGLVLVASGMYEGISLDGDAGTWQVIGKVPYPSLAEPAIAWQAEQDPEAYAWSAIKLLAQASGRICRSPEDWGVTYVADSAFQRLYDERRELFPQWFTEAVVADAPPASVATAPRRSQE